MTELDVPPIVRRKAVAVGAERWLDALPGLVADLEREWAITVGATFGDGTEAFVAEATLDDGSAAVLKLVVPRARDVARAEITVLRLAAGDGCVALLRADEPRGAMLLERLGRPLDQLGLPLDRRLDILVDVAARVWRPAAGCGLPTGADKGEWLIRFITDTWAALDHPCSERAVDHALTCAARRIAAHDDERAVLVHGDVHQWNVCEAGDGFKLIDPDGLLAEPEYDLGVLLREDPVELLDGDPRDRAHRLARRTGLDADAIWEWGVVERVSTGLLATQIGLQPLGDQMLATAEVVAGNGGWSRP
jgi:streptomycin 6-kinase